MRRTVFVCLLVSSFPAPSPGGILHVPGDHPTIQAALDAAADGDEIVVATGTYTELLTFPPRPVTLRSESGNPENTILDGSGYSSGERLIYVPESASGVRSIEGFTIRNALRALRVFHTVVDGTLRLRGNRFHDNGPGFCVDIQGGEAEITDNEFRGNRSFFFGGAINLGVSGSVRGNTFVDNHAVPFDVILLTQGGAIALTGHPSPRYFVEIRDNTFEGNTCTDYGGAIDVGAMTADIVIADNEFRDNFAAVCAGAVYQFGPSGTLTIESNLFVDNRSPLGATIGIEYAVGTTIRRNTIVGSRGGEGIRMHDNSNARLEQNIIAFGESVGVRAPVPPEVAICNDSFGNGASNWVPDMPAGNLSADPLFCDAALGDYTLRDDSPCLPAGNPCALPIGAFDRGCAASAIEPVSWARIKAAYRHR